MTNQSRYRIGGLMRCCIESIRLDAAETASEGDKLQCRHSPLHVMRFRDGAWEWDRQHDGDITNGNH